MITIQSEFHMELSFPINDPYKLEDILFFDIETTGLSASSSFLYLIGCSYYRDSSWHLLQWLADDMNSEVSLLNAFFEKASDYKRLIHYNGSGFDLPYILQKCRHHNIPNVLESIESYDIYKKLLPFKKLLPLINLKLKTVEKFLELEQIDCYTGEQLIPIYSNYLGRVQYEKLHKTVNIISNSPYTQGNHRAGIENSKVPSSNELQQILLLHNSEDIKGLLKILDILYYMNLFEINTTNCTIVNNNFSNDYWTLTLNLPFSIPHDLTWQSPLSEKILELNATGNQLRFRIPLLQGELKYFYDNFKDYYYLPKEDMAIHKNVAMFVDKEFRVKAKASNCYTKQYGTFLPQFKEVFTPFFKEDITNKVSYVDITNSLLEQPLVLQEYVQSVRNYIRYNKDTKIIYN